ncbi:glutathione S-transferase family protein [Paracoccus sp. 11-3]|uniref:glutathione transferase n=1 Tax=Paracoccus amoyensis TaxID=2760093 RepID=A0A926JBS8_9RHOB|nr:glutathione S-transferase family protein [Paracoccus amoyensis]MBC9247436.1 glutathione S-transferase family protein [Paracoccus amoyensis]
MSGELISLGDGGGVCQGGVCELPTAQPAAGATSPLPKLTLISFPTCPYVQRAVIALKERGVDFEVIYIDLAAKPDWFLAISPLGKVPVLKVEREGFDPAILFESTVILQYLDETLPGARLFPEDALDRARQRAWIEYAGSLLGDLFKLSQAREGAAFDEAIAALKARLQPLEAEVRGPFFAGEAFSAVDVVYAPAFRQIDTLQTVRPLNVLDDFPVLDAWRQALSGRPSVKDAVPVDFSERFLDRLRKSDSFVVRER